MMCSVLALNTASAAATRPRMHRARRARAVRADSAAPRSADAFGERRQILRHLARLPGELRQVRGEMHRVLAGAAADLEHRCGWRRTRRASTARIGPLLRSQASDSGQHAREVCDNARMQAIDALLTRRSARALTEPAPDAGALRADLRERRARPGSRAAASLALRRRARRARASASASCSPQHLRARIRSGDEETLQRERAKALRAPLIVVVAARCNPAVKIPLIEQTLSARRGGARHDARGASRSASTPCGRPAARPTTRR